MFAMMSSVPLNVIFCINFLLKNLTVPQSYAVIVNSGLKLDYPTVIFTFEDIKNSVHVPQTPGVYVTDLQKIDEDEIPVLLKSFGRSIYIKYVFIGEAWTSLVLSQFPPEYHNNIIFIKTEIDHGNIFESRGIATNDARRISPSECSYNFKQVGKWNATKKVLKFCFFVSPPYVMPEGDAKKGIEKEIWEALLSSLKAEAEFKLFKFPTGDLTSLMDSFFKNDTCDLFSGLYPIDFEKFDFTHFMFFDSFVWVVQSAQEVPRWKYAFEIFTKATWSLWLLSAVAISVAQYLITRTIKLKGDIKEGLIMFWQYFLQQPQPLTPSRSYEFILLGTLLLATFLMNLFFNTKFMFLLTGMKFDPEVHTFEDVMEKGYTVRSSKSSWQYFQEPEILRYFEKHHKETTMFLGYIDGSTAQLILEKMYSFQIINFLDENHRVSLRKLDTPVLCMPLGNFLRKGSPLTRVLNGKLGRMADNGILTWIYSKYSHKIDKEHNVKVVKLSLESVQLSIIFWLIGMTLACCIFIYEVKF